MNSIICTAALLAQGRTYENVRSLVRAGTLYPVRRGAYHLGPLDPNEDDPGGYLAHRRLIAATLPQLGPEAVLCHGSAAVLHDLPVWSHSLDATHVMRDGNSGGHRRLHVHVHRTPLDDDQITVIDGVRVTTLARTVADLGRSAPTMESVAAGDYSLRLGLDPNELREVLRSMYRWPGVRNARWMADFLDIRSESPGESTSRVRMITEGLPKPELQREIFDDDGAFIARVDFAWDAQRTVGEFDGEIKYGRLLRPGQTRRDVLDQQEIRQRAIEAAGWEVARWGWSELGRSVEMGDRIRRAFRLARERGLSRAA